MKKKILNKQLLFIAFLFCATNCFSQNKKLSIEANLPVLLGQNFLADNYTGVFDLGIAYTFEELNSVKLGGSLNTSFFKRLQQQ